MKKTIIFLFSISIFIPSITVHGYTLESQFETLLKSNLLPLQNQASCVRDTSGDIFSYNDDMSVIPASVSKIYTTDFALSKLPVNFRYTTDFFVEDTTLYINGSNDPHFVIEHLLSILDDIHKKERVRISTITFSPDFIFNWKHDPYDVAYAIKTELALYPNAPVSNNLSVVPSYKKYDGRGSHYEFESAPLVTLLKQINNYSTNIAADVLFQKLGGTDAFQEYMRDEYAVGTETIRFETGSGLRGNYTTCSLTLRVIEHLNTIVENNNLKLTDILAVPKLDPGPLQKRLIDPEYGKMMVAKSGYLNHYHTLAGMFNEKEGPVYFAIFTHFPTLSRDADVKLMIDLFVVDILNYYREKLISWDYDPAETPTFLDNTKLFRLSRSGKRTLL